MASVPRPIPVRAPLVGRYTALRFPLVAALAILAAQALFALPADRAVSQYVHRDWTVQEGLPHGTVRGVVQTSDGYLWLATYEGLVRFNGEKFRVFDNASNPELTNSSIIAICRTRDDTLWLGTAAGLVSFRDGRFVKFTDAAAPDELVMALAESADGALWVGTPSGVTRIAGGHAQRLPLDLGGRIVNALAAGADGAMWIGTGKGGLARHSASKLESFGVADGLSSDTVMTLLPDGRGGVYAGTDAGLDHVDARGAIERVPGLPADQVTALWLDRDANLWIGTYGNGLFRKSGERISSYGIAEGLLNPTVRAFFEDEEGSIWIGSNRGLQQMRAGAFVSWNERHGLGNDFTRAIFEDHARVLWVGTAKGLSRWDEGRWKIATGPLADAYVLSIAEGRDGTHWFGTSNGLYKVSGSTITHLTTAEGLPNNAVRALHEDRRGDLWIGTDNGIARIEAHGKVESFTDDPRLGSGYVAGIAETPDGRIWIATGGGLLEFDGSRFLVHAAPGNLPSNRLFCIDADAAGDLWIGTDGDGLLRYRNGSSRVITTRQGLPYDKILSIVEGPGGNLWIGTARGAFRLRKDDLHAVADGNRPHVRYARYDENDGLASRQCNGSGNPAALRSLDGRIWFATASGISALAGSGAQRRTGRDRPPVVERVTVDGKPVSAASLASLAPATERVELEFSSVTFAAPERVRLRYRLEGYEDNWVEAGANRVASYTHLPPGAYRFVLACSRDGGEWQTSALDFRRKPHLFETPWFLALCVVAAIGLLVAIVRIRLRIARERARVLEILVDERTREIKREKERTELALQAAEAATREARRHELLTEQALAEAEEANRAKSIFLATTSHELRTPLNAIIGFSDILITRAADPNDDRKIRFLHNIRSSGEYLLGIINNILDLSKIEAGRMELQPETIILRDVVDGICAVMKGVTSKRRITYDIDIPSDTPTIEADPTQFKQILYNLMSNAVKFSAEGGTVAIAARALSASESAPGVDAVEIRVTDHGVGIDSKDHQLIFQEFRQVHGSGHHRPEGTGLGLALVKRFVEMHHGTIRVESTPGAGSTFIVSVPCRFRATQG